MERVPPTRTVSHPANGSHAKLRGQGPRDEIRAARRLPARSCMRRLPNCNRRDAVTLAIQQPARPADRSRAATASA